MGDAQVSLCILKIQKIWEKGKMSSCQLQYWWHFLHIYGNEGEYKMLWQIVVVTVRDISRECQHISEQDEATENLCWSYNVEACGCSKDEQQQH